jgi:hypothetical protein
MCTSCVRQTPVGYVCQQCHRQHDNAFFRGTQTDNIVIFAVCAALTGIGGYIAAATYVPFFLVLLLGLPIGGAIGEAALRATGRRRTRQAPMLGVAGCVLGGFAGAALQIIVGYNNLVAEMVAESGLPEAEIREVIGGPSLDYVTQMLSYNWGLLVFIGIAAFGVYSRYRMRL